MSKFKVGDKVRVAVSYSPIYQPEGAIGTVVDIHKDTGFIVQFPTEAKDSGWGCPTPWNSPKLRCEWFHPTDDDLELVVAPAAQPTPESKRSWYIHPEDGVGGRPIEASYQTEQEALDQLLTGEDGTILYRCVPIAKKTSQIIMVEEAEDE